jgi:hypothetical protein
VWASFPLVPALAHDLTAGNDHSADDRVRVRRVAPALCELDRTLEELDIHAK